MNKQNRGFTLIELVVTAAIVAVLASIVLPLTELTAQRSREVELKSALRQIRNAIDDYKRAADRRQIERATDESGYPRRLEDLEEGVPDISLPERPPIRFLRRIPRDPFHPDPLLPAAQTWGKRDYKSPSDAPYEGADVFDVYSLSERDGLNGVPYRQW